MKPILITGTQEELMNINVIGPRILYYLKQGKPVEKIRVFFTREQCHQLFPQAVEKNPRTFQLEMWLAKGMKNERYIDMRKWIVPWDIILRPQTPQPYQKPKVDPAAVQARVELKARYDALIGLGFLPSPEVLRTVPHVH